MNDYTRFPFLAHHATTAQRRMRFSRAYELADARAGNVLPARTANGPDGWRY
jgi:hypothetical protein